MVVFIPLSQHRQKFALSVSWSLGLCGSLFIMWQRKDLNTTCVMNNLCCLNLENHFCNVWTISVLSPSLLARTSLIIHSLSKSTCCTDASNVEPNAKAQKRITTTKHDVNSRYFYLLYLAVGTFFLSQMSCGFCTCSGSGSSCIDIGSGKRSAGLNVQNRHILPCVYSKVFVDRFLAHYNKHLLWHINVNLVIYEIYYWCYLIN